MGKVSDDLISVVVPIYNVENYLERCVKSIQNQTYNNLEIILVDDGSPDNCRRMCDKFQKKDTRIKVIHKENGGLSDARNAGIKMSKGKYITFVDSDDFVEKDYVEYLYNLVKKNNSKIACCGHNIKYGKKNVVKTSDDDILASKIEALNYILYDKNIDICSWGKLYNIDLFDMVKFPKGKLFEDTATTYLLFEQCDYISVGKECKYNYVIRDNSITSKSFNLKKMDLIEMTENMCNYLNIYDELKDGIDRRLMWAYMSTFTKIIYTDKNEYLQEKNKINNYIKKNRKQVLSNKKICKRDRIALILYSFGTNLFKIFWKLYNILRS